MIRLNSIQTRLIGVALIFIVGTSITMGFIYIRLTTRLLTDRFHENFELLASYISRNAELGVLIKDQEMLKRLIGNLLEEKDIVEVTIQSDSGDIFASQKKPFADGKTGTVVAPIMSYQMGEESMILSEVGLYDQVGRVVLRYSYRGLDLLKTMMAKRIIFLSLILSVIPVGMYWFIAGSIIGPLNDLVQVSKEVSKGRMDVRAGGGKFRETQVLASMFNTMLSALKEKQQLLEDFHNEMARQRTLAEVGKLSMTIAHEVKNPLSIMQGCIDILKKKEAEPETKNMMLLYLQEEVGRINRLMEDFLAFSIPKEPHFTEIEINRFVSDLVNRFNLIDNPEEVNLRFHIDKRGCLLSVDPHLIERAMGNLIKNARDICTSVDTVDVATETDGYYWKFIVKDTGPGIASENLTQIFEPFFTTRAKGTGLGLTVAKEIVEVHGGEIHAGNRTSGGAFFEIRLPRRDIEGTIEDTEQKFNPDDHYGKNTCSR